jgi:ABC-2 type transport system permease protein
MAAIGSTRERFLGRWRRLLDNPVTVKELRGRMRGRRAFVVLTLYLALMSGLIALIYLAFVAAANTVSGPETREAGKAVFATVVGVEVFLVLFIGPAFTASAISGEKERQTYDLLRTTLLSPQAIVGGKLLSALSYVLLLVLASIPVQSIAFMLGGVSPSEVLVSQLVIIVAAVAYAVVGLYASSVMRTTLAATVATYASAIFLTVGLPIIILLLLLLSDTFAGAAPGGGWLAEALFAYFSLFLATLNLPATLIFSEFILTQEGSLWGFTERFGGHNVFIYSPWYINLFLYALLAAILFGLTVHRVRLVATK